MANYVGKGVANPAGNGGLSCYSSPACPLSRCCAAASLMISITSLKPCETSQ